MAGLRLPARFHPEGLIRRRRRLLTLVMLFAGTLFGCAGDYLVMTDAGLFSNVDFFWLGSYRSEGDAVYTTEDEKVVLSARFQVNLVGNTRTFRTLWYGPDGKVFRLDWVKMATGSNQELIVPLLIKGHEPANMPGPWRVDLYLREEQLASLEFTIVVPCDPADSDCEQELDVEAGENPQSGQEQPDQTEPE